MAKIPMVDWEKDELMLRDFLRHRISETHAKFRKFCQNWQMFTSYNVVFRRLTDAFFSSRGSEETIRLSKIREDIKKNNNKQSVYNYLDLYSLDEYLQYLENILTRMHRIKDKYNHKNCEHSDFESALEFARKDLRREDNRITLLGDGKKFVPERTLRSTEFVKKYGILECERKLDEWRKDKNPFHVVSFNFNYKGEGFLVEDDVRYKDINGNIVRYIDAYNHRARLMGYFDMNNSPYYGDLYDIETGELVVTADQAGVDLYRTDNPFSSDVRERDV